MKAKAKVTASKFITTQIIAFGVKNINEVIDACADEYLDHNGILAKTLLGDADKKAITEIIVKHGNTDTPFKIYGTPINEMFEAARKAKAENDLE